ncbi:AraC family transcriptional regulator [Gramella sp. BOM4]|nr:AraC family transcriptional regulator [Christiangramia bathymodioli]
MEGYKLHIKNVVCQRCIMSVRNILERLEIPYSSIGLGEAVLNKPLSSSETKQLQAEFEKVGFEILKSRNEKLINDIKSMIIEEVYSDEPTNQKLSSLLSSRLNFDYSHITHIFTESEGQSIQKFYNAIRIERAKELLGYNELDIAEIADRLGYSTPAYLSTSFKKATGISPSEYKNLYQKDRQNLDSV